MGQRWFASLEAELQLPVNQKRASHLLATPESQKVRPAEDELLMIYIIEETLLVDVELKGAATPSPCLQFAALIRNISER
jgi:hypothetical protein